MALYRHNATGFIGEFATNPGAGYTAISSMPTTSIADRANWWRGIDTYGQTSDWHPSVDDDAEDPNDNFLALVFTNESALVSADPDGNVTDGFLGATTQVRVMRGSRNVTESEGWSLGLGKSPDVPSFTYTWTGTDYKTLQITGFPVDETSGYIRITAVRSGSQTLVKDFKFLKVIRGEDGTNGADGTRGSRQIAVSGTSWSDAVAWNAIISQFGGSTPVLSDLVTIADAATSFSVSKFYTGGAYDGNWEQPNEYINGNLLVTGTIAGNKLVANTITASKIATGTITTAQLSFTPVQSTNVVASINASAEGIRITGNRITLDGTVSFGVGYDPTGKIASGGAAADVNNNVTTISGGKITTGSITTAQLNFAPVTTSNVVASINATAEGIRIAGSRITLDGTVSFGAGYDPTTKIAAGGAATDINNNVTTISGGKITTGSLNADRIEAGTITADRITIGGVTTDRIASGAVTSVNTGGSSNWSGLYPNGTHTISTITIPSVSAGTRGTLLLQGSIAFLYGGNAVSTFPKIQVICGRTGYLTQGFVWQPFIPAAGGAGQYEWAIPFGFMDTDSNTAGRTYIVQIYAECYFYWQGAFSLSELKR